MGRAAPELHIADERDLAQRHARHLGAQIHDELADRRCQGTEVVVLGGRSIAGQQATHAGGVKAVGRTVNGTFRGASRTSAVSGRFSKDNDRPHQLVEDLFGPLQMPTQAQPVFRSLMNHTFALGHGCVRRSWMRHA